MTLFDELYSHAFRREHAVIMEVKRLHTTLPEVNLAALGRLARSLLAEFELVLTDLDSLAVKHRLKRPKGGGCPYCDDPNCQAGVVKLELYEFGDGTKIIKKYYGQ
jgi:hypothetical protein